jgi:hypothetical protein
MYDDLKIIISSISIFSNLIAIVYYFAKKIKQEDLELERDFLLYISLICLLDSTSHIIYLGTDSNNILCTLQAFFLIWFRLILQVLITLVSIHVYIELTRVQKMTYRKIKLIRIYYVIIAVIPSLAFTIYGYFAGYYGPTRFWCWVTIDSGVIFRYIIYGFSYIILITNLIFAILSKKAAKRKPPEQINNDISYYNQYICYPILMMIFYAFTTISVILKTHGFEESEFLVLAILLIETSQGFWYLVIGLLCSRLPNELCNFFYKLFKRDRTQSHNSEGVYTIIEI